MGERYHLNQFMGQERNLVSVPKTYFETEIEPWIPKLVKHVSKLDASIKFSDDVSIYTGSSGIGLLFWKFSNILDNFKTINFRSESKSIIEHGVKKCRNRRATFLCGDAGPLALALVSNPDDPNKSKYVQKLENLYNLCDSQSAQEILYGTAGLLYSYLFVNEKLPGTFTPQIISRTVKRLFESGFKSPNEPLYYEWHEKAYLGAAHGFVGILYILLKTKEYLSSDQLRTVKLTIDWLLSQCFPSGNLRSSVGSNTDKLIHWCHGAPGAVYLFIQAHKDFGDDKYKEAALKCGDVIWERGILRTSYSLCHGVSGNAYGLIALYKFTEDEIYLKRALLFAKWCCSYGTKSDRDPDRPYSLFEGIAGPIYLLLDLKSFFNYHTVPVFPAFE